MCLIINKPADVTFSSAWLSDFFASNSDGFGIMYSEQGHLEIIKAVPKNVQDFIKAFRAIEHRPALIHLRMRTHGNINMENTHPYPVLTTARGDSADVYVMHNGILHDVANDHPEMSDTWHYIRDTLRPMGLALGADVFFEPTVLDLIGQTIGPSNKLVFMDGDGRVSVVNEHTGVGFRGAWLSNTYAWSYHLRKEESPRPPAATAWRNSWAMPKEAADDTACFTWDRDESEDFAEGFDFSEAPRVTLDEMSECDFPELYDLVKHYPLDTAEILADMLGIDTEASTAQVAAKLSGNI